MKTCKTQEERTQEERTQRKRAIWSKYSNKDWKCDVCNIQILLGNKPKHIKTQKHQSRL